MGHSQEKLMQSGIQDAGLYQTYCLKTKVSTDELLDMLLRHNRTFRAQLAKESKRLQADAWAMWANQMQHLQREYQFTGRWPDKLEAQVHADRETRLAQVESNAKFDCYDAILRGELGRGLITPGPHAWNKVVNGYLIHTEGARLCNSHTSNEDGIIKYLAVGTGNVAATVTDVGLGRETFRKTPDTRKNTTAGSKIILKLDFTEANLTAVTHVQPGEHNQLTFAVDDTTGFNIGDAIEVGTLPAKSYSRITAITPGTPGSITVATSEPLLHTPLEGQTVTLMLGEFGAFGNGLATATPSSGTLFSRSASAQTRIHKNDDLCWFIKYQYIRTAI